ncbi:MAG TPA: conjugal transfer protein TraF [Vicinamibacterales bacterium]|nr:conjugal transfer protein TraF [Vicinamibacterales bacterium]
MRSVSVSQFGATVGQSIGESFVIGTTLKLLRAGTVSSSSLGSDPLEDADDLEVSRHLRADLDVGAMANFGRVRFGITVRNLGQPSFGDEGGERLSLKRQARVGVAVLSVPNGALQGFTAAADADLTTTSTAVGEVRHVAAGIEGWLAKGRLGLRAGASASTVGERRPAGSVGASVAVTRAIHVNVSRTAGQDESVTGWSSSVSVAF